MTVVSAQGFRSSGVAAGIKASGGLDLALIDAGERVPAAAVFTTSATAAPPVVLCRERIAAGTARAVIVNSGSANAGTGADGYRDAMAMAKAAAAELGCGEEEVLVSSTGPIGGRLPLDRIGMALPHLVASLGAEPSHGMAAAEAIMTTDSVPKAVALDRGGFRIGGIAKGAGMLRPNMATMLAYLTTDAVADPAILRPVLRSAVAATFNCLNVDGCQSTNDTVVLMASGASGHRLDVTTLAEAVEAGCAELAAQLARDAEGASKVVTIRVEGAASFAEARRVGMEIADSALVRASFYGADPNWGRVLAAVGVAGVALHPEDIDIAYQQVTVCRGGVGVPFDEEALSTEMDGDFELSVRVGDGPGSATILTTDLTPDYVRFNGERS